MEEQADLIFAGFKDDGPQLVPHLACAEPGFRLLVGLLARYRAVQTQFAFIFRGIAAIGIWRINHRIFSPRIIDASLEAFPRISDVLRADHHLIVGMLESQNRSRHRSFLSFRARNE